MYQIGCSGNRSDPGFTRKHPNQCKLCGSYPLRSAHRRTSTTRHIVFQSLRCKLRQRGTTVGFRTGCLHRFSRKKRPSQSDNRVQSRYLALRVSEKFLRLPATKWHIRSAPPLGTYGMCPADRTGTGFDIPKCSTFLPGSNFTTPPLPSVRQDRHDADTTDRYGRCGGVSKNRQPHDGYDQTAV